MRLVRHLTCSAIALLALTACNSDVVTDTPNIDISCAMHSVASDDVKHCANEITAQLTLQQKVGQMIQGEIRDVSPEDVRTYGLGSVLNGGGSFPQENKYATTEDWVRLSDAYYEASVDTSTGGAGIPIVWGTDAVHGHNNVMGATLFPHNIGLGATRDTELCVSSSTQSNIVWK